MKLPYIIDLCFNPFHIGSDFLAWIAGKWIYMIFSPLASPSGTWLHHWDETWAEKAHSAISFQETNGRLVRKYSRGQNSRILWIGCSGSISNGNVPAIQAQRYKFWSTANIKNEKKERTSQAWFHASVTLVQREKETSRSLSHLHQPT